MDNLPQEESTRRNLLDRRSLLYGAAATLPLTYAGLAVAQAPNGKQTAGGQPFPGLIARQREPDNLEFPFPTLDSFLVPTDRFYVRSHFPVPALDVKTWRLRVEGEVKKPLELTFDQLRK